MDATAAYNFIPLPDKILPADLDAYRKDLLSDDETRRHKAFRAFLNKKGNLSGHIDLDMETLTPLFIGGNGEQPFSPAGRVILPGSTIRGMVKNLQSIIHGIVFAHRSLCLQKSVRFVVGHPPWQKCLI